MAATSATPMPALPGRTRPRAVRLPVSFTRRQLAITSAFVGGHIVLAILMRTVPAIATAHAMLCGLVGLVYAATTRRIRNIAIAAAYLAGCEVLWRMCKADVFWEFGKYSISAMLLVALFRIRVQRNRVLAPLYFLLLLPSTVLTLSALSLENARQEISFNLSGALALAICVLFFSNIRLSASQLVASFFALIGPVIGIAALSIMSTRAQDDIEFVNAANSATSGGFGPNQVSAMLGLGMMFLLLVVLTRKLRWSVRAVLFGVAAILATQSALTFSRGGIVLAFAGLGAAMFLLGRGNPRARIAIVAVAIISFVLGKYVIEPRLDDFTKGELSQRYSNTTSSGRDIFISSELELFSEEPILGVGPGMGMRIRAEREMFHGASHTEYTRALAEHGLLGLLSLVCLFLLGWRAVRQQRDLTARALTTAMVVWVGLFLLVYGTRIVAPAFIFGLAFVRPPLVKRAAPLQPVTT